MGEAALDLSRKAAEFRRDGAVHLPGALSPMTLALAQEAYEWSLANPGPGAAQLPARGEGGGVFYQDLANPAALAAYRRLVTETEIGDLVTALWGKAPVWFMYEQVFKKSGGATRRTPWHQDLPYLPVRGDDLVVIWMSFESIPKGHALEFVRGSHQGTVYDGSRFDPEDDTAPIYGDGSFPRLPDIEAERERWPITSWASEPGDVIAFHPATLHGGGATDAALVRRTLSLRFFGEDAVVATRPGPPVQAELAESQDPAVHPLVRVRALPDGQPFRNPGFPVVRPRA